GFLATRAKTLGAGLVTTEKDWVRLSPEWRSRVAPWPVRARFASEDQIDSLLESVMRRGSERFRTLPR
ncbi:hypothetical protein ABLW54_23565, partial [Salmonella enterica]|uniref:hypothetical protein n=1 Tax=Salmonella enterica TaxID=28901 RepID=UPI0032B4434D